MKLEVYEKEHLKKIRKYLAECTVLLKYDGAFPLVKPGRIALYGNGARHTQKGGTGSGEVNSRFFVTAERGLLASGFEVTSKRWLDSYDEVYAEAKKSFRRQIIKEAIAARENPASYGMGRVMREPDYDLPLSAEGDACVYVLARVCGEGDDRSPEKGDLRLTDTEVRDILALNAKFERFMLVLNTGGPVDLTPVADVGNILLLSQLGVDTGLVLSRILLGRSYPSGRLTTTWTAWTDYPMIGQFGDPDETRYREGIYVGYRYFSSTGIKPMFPFGYGLSYTTFATVCPTVRLEGEEVTVKASVGNTGVRPGREIVQVYVTKPEGRLPQPSLVLAGWAKTPEIQAGEGDRVSISFRMSELASYDAENEQYILEAGDYIIRVGTDSENHEPVAVIRLAEDIVTEKTVNRCGTPDFEDWRVEKRQEEELPEGLTVLEMESGAVSVRDFRELQPADVEIPEEIRNLSDEELIYMNLGAFLENASALSIVGNASQSVAGAAGETTGKCSATGGLSLVMADGPAGLRLSRQYWKDENGIHNIGLAFPETMLEFIPDAVKKAVRRVGLLRGRKGTICEQYATAIPIGTAIAQSFNTEVAEVCGDVVGAEMERFGVQLWLAPALNIHRNVLCGRNFEYYSEDPLVSGVFAAAITKGVQKHRNCGVTIKHYCANNQEKNRLNNNSQVSERAMREIYLKGFEIAVRDSQPAALMSSYNLLNGLHTSENRQLIEEILRGEFGYRGIVMTDWVIAGMENKNALHPDPAPWRIAASGHELMMPGSKVHYEKMLQALKDGTLAREQVERNASRLLAMIRKLHS